MEIIVKRVSKPGELDQVIDVRHRVFVQEQGIDSKLEQDSHEDSCSHFLALCNGIAVGAARWRKTPGGTKLERFAVLHDYRKHGIGSKLLEAVLADIGHTNDLIYLHSQKTAIIFYAKNGFQNEGEEFFEAGISHSKMIMPPKF